MGKQAVSRRMGIQKVRLVQVGMEPVNPGPVKLCVHEWGEFGPRRAK